jgi:hypothetical protein
MKKQWPQKGTEGTEIRFVLCALCALLWQKICRDPRFKLFGFFWLLGEFYAN